MWHKASVAAIVSIYVSLFAASANADSIVVEHRAGDEPSQVEIMLQSKIEASELATTFVGVTIKAGTTATCAANYAQDLETPGSYMVLTNTGLHGEIEPSRDGGVGLRATVPGGAWSLCGWVQPTGNTTAAIPSAVSGPSQFTIGGPTGTTSLAIPTNPAAGAPLALTVQYATQELVGEIPGVDTASLYVFESPGASGCSSSTSRPFYVSATGQAGLPVAGAQTGTATFSGTLAAGTYSICAYMLQSFVSDNMPGILPQAFARSTAVATVTAVSSRSSQDTPAKHVATPLAATVSHRCATVRDASLVAAVTERRAGCHVARTVVLKLVHRLGDIDARGSRTGSTIKVAMAGGSFACGIQDSTKSRYSVVCARGRELIDAKVSR